jgi:hypothetical protein
MSIFVRSSFFESTQERWKNSASSVCDITDAIEVFPHHGGHQRIIEGTFPASIYFLSGFQFPKRCFCPMISSSDFGRSMDARGLIFFIRRNYGCIVHTIKKLSTRLDKNSLFKYLTGYCSLICKTLNFLYNFTIFFLRVWIVFSRYLSDCV